MNSIMAIILPLFGSLISLLLGAGRWGHLLAQPRRESSTTEPFRASAVTTTGCDFDSNPGTSAGEPTKVALLILTAPKVDTTFLQLLLDEGPKRHWSTWVLDYKDNKTEQAGDIARGPAATEIIDGKNREGRRRLIRHLPGPLADRDPANGTLRHQLPTPSRLYSSRSQSNSEELAPHPPQSIPDGFNSMMNLLRAASTYTDRWYPNQRPADHHADENRTQSEPPSMQGQTEKRQLRPGQRDYQWLAVLISSRRKWKHYRPYGVCQATVGFLGMLPTVAAQPVERQKTDPEIAPDPPTHSYPQFLNWALPPAFLLMLAYVELAGRYYKQRRKWYVIAIVLSNLSFPWLVEHDGISPMFTVCVFAFALRPAWAYAMMDYDELRPSPAFYTVMAVGGFGIAAMVTALSQNGSIPGTNTSSGGNPFSVYLLFGMTASMILCGRCLAACKEWISSHALSKSCV